MEEWTPTCLSSEMPPGLTSSGASHQSRMEEWTPTCLSPDMPPGLTSPMQGSDQDGGVDTHSSKSRHAPSLTSSGASHQSRKEGTTTCLSPEMPPGPTSPVQGSDQDGGVDTYLSESRDAPWSNQSCAGVRPGWRSGYPSSESRHAPGWTSSDASCQTRMEKWTPTLPSPKMPPGLTNLCRGHTRMDEWIPTHPSPDMPLVGPVVMQAVGPGWRSGHPLFQVQRCPLVRPVCAGVRPGWGSGYPLI